MKVGSISGFRRTAAFLAALVAGTTAFAQSRDLTIELEPAFTDMRAGDLPAMIPVRATLRNSGPSATGQLEVRLDEYEMTYPVDLPSGSVKQVMAYVPSSPFGTRPVFELGTDRGWAKAEFEIPFDPGAARGPILYVGDATGAMVFMRSAAMANPAAVQTNPRDVYCVPGSLPDRASGYWALRAVVLGGGAERMTDVEVKALKTWVVAGGTLVMIGGASSPVLSDPRWAQFVPIRNARAATVPASSVLGSIGRAAVPLRPVAVMSGQAAPGCESTYEGPTPLIVRRPVGMGKVVFFAFNPFEEPLRLWAGRARLFTVETEPSFGGTVFDLAATVNHGGIMASMYATPSGVPFHDESDPFSVRLPPTNVIAWTLVAYMVVVVPLNLIVLKRIGRSEWAWGTTPIISVVFAGVFFQFAGSLYSAQKSVVADGILVMDTRSDTGLYVGRSQMFFPRGGTYDLGLTQTEAAYAGNSNEDVYVGRRQRSRSPFSAVDDGEVRVDRLRVSNLSFVDMNVVQRASVGNWIDAQVKVTPDGSGATAAGTITNRSPYTITGTLRCGRYAGSAFSLPPGASTRFDGSILSEVPRLEAEVAPRPGRYGARQGRTVDLAAGDPDRVFVYGSIEGFRPGPQLGPGVGGRNSVSFVAVLGDAEVVGR